MLETTVLNTENLSVSRGDKQVLHRVQLHVRRGECVTVIGPNGAGKSTLMLALMGLLRVDEGTVYLEGMPLPLRGGRRSMARRVAYVPQQYEGFLGFTVQDMVSAARYAHMAWWERYSSVDRHAVAQAIEDCGLRGMNDRLVSQLSGGERQRVLLAAALAQESPILFLDEPTHSLDPKYQQQLVAILGKLREVGKTIVLISHDLNVPAALQSRVIALREGRIAYDGSYLEFVQSENASVVFESRFELLTDGQGRLRISPL